jgi:hypothetical protein
VSTTKRGSKNRCSHLEPMESDVGEDDEAPLVRLGEGGIAVGLLEVPRVEDTKGRAGLGRGHHAGARRGHDASAIVR